MNAPTELIQKNTACPFCEQAVVEVDINIRLLFFQNTVAVGAEEH